jgi:cellulose biosynthesis protein BcsQ
VCLHARAAGKRVVVVDVDTHHHSTVGWKSPEIEARFVESERMFREKWSA